MLLARGAAVAEILLAGAPWQSDCREAAPWRSCWLGRCGGAAGWGAVAKMLMPGRSHREEGKTACEKEKQHLRRTCTYPSR